MAKPSDKINDPRTGPLLAKLIQTCLNLADDGIAVADLKLIESAMDEIRRGLACFRPYASVRKVTTFGSARTRPDTPTYDLARDFSRRIADAGFMVITGAGPGIMEACQQGAGRKRSFGVNIKLPFENAANPVIRGDRKLVDFKYFFTRKLFFLKESSAVVLLPGGFGTHDEGFETLTLVQTGKAQLMPIILLDIPGGDYWQGWDDYVRRHLLGRGLISPADLNLYSITDNVDTAVQHITDFYRCYHSSRVVRRRLVLRTTQKLGETALASLSEEFSDILGGQSIRQRGVFKEEFDEPALDGLTRLVTHFDMESYGRLRTLIDRLNQLAPAAG